MKRIIYFLLATSLFSRGEKTKGVESKIYTEKQVSDFIRVNQKWTAADEQITEKFKHRLINMSNEANFLTDFPLQLKEIRDTLASGQSVKLAVFKAFKDESRAPEALLNHLELEIDGIFPIDEASKLGVNQKYTLKGMLFKQGKRSDIKVLHDEAEPIYTLGKYTFWNLEAKAL